ncbi:ABC transporter permease subunit [Paenibacillus aurantius]|uniref:ABC transporter permease subunit n=1 Tax=Paenibacillus aurantius TaxID=2918900 RepID=A0AA96LHQ2_9BACL|nr:ABC transporter permease subunit [Paenibacillus aurantius]WNQ11642.1 ABC transporter permease subunit [Paenibacillus aurantius]
MRRTWAIARKELQMYFYSPTAYVAFAFYFLISGFFFSMDFLNSQTVDIRPLFGNFMVVYLFVIPLLTMRLVSDELRHGTDELLLTSPAGIGEIILGKYLAAVIVQFLLVAGALVYPLILSSFGPLDQPVMWLSFLSMFLLGAAMMAVGLFASTLSAHQMVAGIAGFAMLLVLWMIEWMGYSVYTSGKEWLGQFSIAGRTTNLQKGVLDLSDILFYISFIAVFIVLSIQTLERKRWR